MNNYIHIKEKEDHVMRSTENMLKPLADSVTIERIGDTSRYRLNVKHDGHILIDREMGNEGFSTPYIHTIEGTIRQMKGFINGDRVKVNLWKGERMFVEEVLRFMEGIPLTFDIQVDVQPLKGR